MFAGLVCAKGHSKPQGLIGMRSRLHKLTVEEERATVLDGIEHHIEWVRVLVEGEAVWRGVDGFGGSTARGRGGLGGDREAGGWGQKREKAVTPVDIFL